MGGTFDPIHLGHLIAASEAFNQFALDDVIFVPAGEPWQKTDREISAAEDRYQMTLLATAADPRFSVSRIELDRPGPSYTSDTLRQLHADLVTSAGLPAELFFIVGADALAGIAGWHESDKLPFLAHFVGVTRPGHVLRLPPNWPPASASGLEIPALAITSTQCRERVGLNQPISYLVPAETIAYIATRRLYRSQP